MTIFIGITQTPAETEEFISMEWKEIGEKTLVGPFNSPNAAKDWLQFMMVRRENTQQLRIPEKLSTDGHWYGLTFEQSQS